MQKSNKNEALLPGRILDSLIAEKIMGLKVEYDKEMAEANTGTILDSLYHQYGWTTNDKTSTILKYYSTDIEAAWEVVEKLREKHWYFILSCHHSEWSVMIDNQTEGDDIAIADTAPHAICLAALKAVGVDTSG